MVGEQSEKVTNIATGSSSKTRFHKKGPSPLHQFVKVVMDDGGPKYEDIFLFTLNPPLHILFSYAASLLKRGRERARNMLMTRAGPFVKRDGHRNDG